MGRSVVLIGFMGSGKSTLGRLLSKQLGLDFVDLDEWIEQREGQSVASLFAERGEPGFRQAERQALADCMTGSSPIVLACGGGTPCQPGLLDALLDWGEVLFLDVPLEALKRRSLPGRPLWDDSVEERYIERQPLYRRAPIHLDGTLPPEVLVAAAVRGLELRQ